MSKKLVIIIISIAIICLLSLLGGAAVNSAIKATSTTDFCISCHEMQSTVYQEYKKTIHFQNASGVRAGCGDCHIPHDWGTTLWRKFLASKDVYHHLLGTIDTQDKFEQQRLAMAKRVWSSMKESDSRECRNCHHFDSMDMEKQKPRARKQHEQAIDNNETCIDCHKGIAHKAVHQELETPAENEELKLEF
ncbi:MAG: NapC/NirT family cytochrome c [Gammaproteobacteria bacterium]|nr:NapC/NirT family cytochrome c [Gammaproteobacteria bacterium]